METKKNFFPKAAPIAVASFLCALVFPVEAQAGFQWVSPEQEVQSQVQQYATPSYQEPTLVPQIIQGMPSVQAPKPTLAPAPAQIAGRAYEMPVPAPEEAIVLGFADNIPLSVAIRQVLPSDYGFSVARDVSMGTLVSWKGGASWRVVMKKMLAPASLAMVEEGPMVKIVPVASLETRMAGASSALAMPDKDGFSVVLPSDPIEAPPLAGEVGIEGTVPAPSMTAQGVAAMPDLAVAPSAPQPVSLLTPPQASQSLTVSGNRPFMNRPMPLAQSARSVPSYPAVSDAIPVWTGARGTTLHTVLQSWCDKAGVELSWQSEFDYPLQAAVSLEGSFEKAVRSLLSGFQEAKPQPVGRLHRNQSAGQAVLVVQARGNNYMD